MPGAARLGDTGQGHACFPDTPVTEGSHDISINGRAAARQGDTVALHGCPCPNTPHGMHAREIAAGSSTVSFTWDDKNMASYRLQYGVNDFSPKSQDEFCVLIFKYKRKGSLDKIISGDIDGALDVLSYEWASLPPGRYGQPAKTRKDVISIYEKYLSDELNGETDLHVSSEFINDVIKG